MFPIQNLSVAMIFQFKLPWARFLVLWIDRDEFILTNNCVAYRTIVVCLFCFQPFVDTAPAFKNKVNDKEIDDSMLLPINMPAWSNYRLIWVFKADVAFKRICFWAARWWIIIRLFRRVMWFFSRVHLILLYSNTAVTYELLDIYKIIPFRRTFDETKYYHWNWLMEWLDASIWPEITGVER